VDPWGDLFIADMLDQVVLEVNPAGTISTVAGDGVSGFSGEGALATSAELNYPRAVTVDGTGNIYISDEQNFRVREVMYGTPTPSPTITSVTPILPQQTQTITITGSGFGSQTAYTGDSPYILLADYTGTPWYAGYSRNAITLAVSSWSDSQIVLTGFTGGYGTDGMCIKPGDQLYVEVWNPQTGSGPAYYPFTAGGGTNTCAPGPTITSVSAILPQQTQTITISGSGFGTQAAYTGDSPYILLADYTGTPWYAGYSRNAITLAVSSWSDSQIVLTGFTGGYGTDGMCIKPGDQLYVEVWNPQTGSGPAYYPFTAGGGTNTCAPGPTITSVSPILPQQTQTITISGSGFGTQATYTGDSPYILLADYTGTPGMRATPETQLPWPSLRGATRR